MEKSLKKLIYVSGPYTGKDYEEIEYNIANAEDASVELFKLGWNVFTPHKNTAHYEIYEEFDYSFWLTNTLDMLTRCDAIFMLDGWRRSRGAKEELERAKELNMPIFYEEDGYPKLGI